MTIELVSANNVAEARINADKNSSFFIKAFLTHILITTQESELLELGLEQHLIKTDSRKFQFHSTGNINFKSNNLS